MNLTAEKITNPQGKTVYVLMVDGKVVGNQIETQIKSNTSAIDEFTVTFSGRIQQDGTIDLNRPGLK